MVDLRYPGSSRSVSFGLHLWLSPKQPQQMETRLVAGTTAWSGSCTGTHTHGQLGEQVKGGSTEQTPTLGIAEFNVA